jgi:hypothetical protein
MADTKTSKGFFAGLNLDDIDWDKIRTGDGDTWNHGKPSIPKDPLLQKMKEEKLKKAKMEELDKAKAKERAKKFSYIKNPKRLFDKLTSNPVIIGIVLVTGYFAYKKFKK